MFKGMTVLESVMTGLHARLRATPWSAMLSLKSVRDEEREAAAERRASCCSSSASTDFADRESSGLSFGQQRLVEIARALVSEPRILLLDEPAVGLSAVRVKELDTLLRRIREERGVTIVMIEHVVKLVMGVCDFVTVMSSGQADRRRHARRGGQRSAGHRSLPRDRANAERRACERLVRRDAGAARRVVRSAGQAGDRAARRQRRRQVDHAQHAEWTAEAAQRHRYASRDTRVDGLHPHDIVVRGMAQVPQGRYMWPTMTVVDNIALGAITRHDKAAIRDDIAAVLDMFPVLAERSARGRAT